MKRLFLCLTNCSNSGMSSLRSAFHFTAILFLLSSGLVFTTIRSQVVHASSPNPIVLENQQSGSTGWQFDNYNKATKHEIEGYASLTSVNKGSAISFMVSLSANAQYRMDIYRMGYYLHGTNPDNTSCSPCGGRLMQSIGPLNGTIQPACPTVISGTNFGLTECKWAAVYTLTVPTTWTTGNYIIKLHRLDDNLENYMTFVVRDDTGSADIVYSMDVTTWQAYNYWGGAGNNNVGYNLYGQFNDVTQNFIGNNRAYNVSFDRPYIDQGTYDGAGSFMLWDYPMISWIESQGYNVTYATDVDLESNPNLLSGHKVFMNTGHDEYYSDNMRANIQNFLSAGGNLAFFSANNIYTRITWGNSTSNQSYRRVYCDKGAFSGSTTIQWRILTPPQPENMIEGVVQNGAAASRPFMVYDATNWIFAGTGLVNYNGQAITSGPGQNAIAGLIGYEFDERATNAPSLSAYASYEPHGVQQAGHSFVPASDNGVNAYADTVVYTAPSGGSVFAAGTLQWSWGVDNGFNDGFCNCNPGYANKASQQITANVLNRFIGANAPAVHLSPGSLNFGNQNVGATSAVQTVTLTNSGSATLTTSNIALTGTNASDFAQTNTCPATLTTNASCTINVTFTPTVAGARSASVTVTDNASDSPQSVALSGSGQSASAPGVSLNPTSVSFGNQNVGTSSAAHSVTLTNSGSATLTMSTIAVTGTNAASFAETNNCPSSLSASATCTISVTFSPAATGISSASVTVTDNASDSPQMLALSGNGGTQTVYFNDGFESGNLSAWTLPSSDSTGSATVQSSVVNSGHDALDFHNTSGQYAYVYTSLPAGPQAQTFTRFYFRYDSSVSNGTQLAIARNVNGGNVWEVDLNPNRHGLDIYFWNGANQVSIVSSASNVFSANTWYSVEIQDTQATNGHGEVWMNGNSLGAVTGDLSMASPYARLMLYADAPGNIYYDDVRVSDMYNGL